MIDFMDIYHLIGKKVIAEKKGILIRGLLLQLRTRFGRVDGLVRLPKGKGGKSPEIWFRHNKITAAKP